MSTSLRFISGLRFIAGLSLGAAVALPTLAVAKPVTLVPCRTHDEAQEKSDFDAVRPRPRFGSPEAVQQLPAFEAALAHAPDVPSQPEICGAEIHVYGSYLVKGSDEVVAVQQYLKDHPELGAKTVVEKRELPYASLAAFIGLVKSEQKDYPGALAAAEKGLLNDPGDATLVDIKAQSLYELDRNDEALKTVDAYLTAYGDDPELENTPHTTLLGTKSRILKKLGRDADAAAVDKEVDAYRHARPAKS